MAAGRMGGEPAAVVLTGRRLMLVNERAWTPVVVILTVDPGLTVQGWQDSRTASLTFVADDGQYVIEQILDKGLAVEIAGRIRNKTGTG